MKSLYNIYNISSLRTFMLASTLGPWTLCLVSCSELVDKIHRDMDQQSGVEASINNANNNLSNNANNNPNKGFKTKKFDKRPIVDPLTYTLEGDKISEDLPMNTGPMEVKRHFRASDFEDNDQTASLWQSYDDASSFFTSTNDRKAGQIIVIDVMEGLRKTIISELKRAYPSPTLFQDDGGSSSSANVASNSPLDNALKDLKTPEGERSAASLAKDKDGKEKDKEKEKEKEDNVEIVYDRISTRIDKTFQNDHILLKGRKEVVFRNKKRLVEIHALVKKNTLDPKDHVKSDDIIESRVFLIGANNKEKSLW